MPTEHQPIDVEQEFSAFVRNFGGEVIQDNLPKSPSFLNADYLFREVRVVAELKRLEQNKAEDQKIHEKIQRKFDGWMNDGTIEPIYGNRVRIDSKDLPEKCQRELIEVYKPAIQKRIIKANKQIKATLNHFAISNGQGLLILVNDGNFALEAHAVLWLVSQILGAQFKLINSVIYCTVNMFASSPFTPKPTLVWVHSTRHGTVASVSEDFIAALFSGWKAHLENLTNTTIDEFHGEGIDMIEPIKYMK